VDGVASCQARQEGCARRCVWPRERARQLRGESRIIRMGYGTDELYTLCRKTHWCNGRSFLRLRSRRSSMKRACFGWEAAMTRS